MNLTRRELLTAAASAGAAACAAVPVIGPISTPAPAECDVCAGDGRAGLKLLTWNIFMMPPFVGESPRNNQRAAAIGATLLEQDFDILCLQKAFDADAREILVGVLGSRYPHRYGPANDHGCFKTSSGVWVLSREPLADQQEIQFGECASVECFSRKGAMMLSGRCGEATFRLVTTHLQGEEGPSSRPVNQPVRDRQMKEIWDDLVAPHLQQGVPFILCGDLGTAPFADDHSETDAYRRMVALFGMDNGAGARITLDDARRDNALAIDDTGWKNELDYVLVRGNGRPVAVERECHVFRRDGWDSGACPRVDLSYRYAVSARIHFGASTMNAARTGGAPVEEGGR